MPDPIPKPSTDSATAPSSEPKTNGASTDTDTRASAQPSSGAMTATKPADDKVNPLDFGGSVQTTNALPSAQTLKKIEDYVVLDRTGRTRPFRSLYSGPHVARRVLVVFVRHFFCGNCQEYVRRLSESIAPDALLGLPVSTFVAVVGCGDPGLIDMYAEATGCPFPIYADPTRKLYDELGMVKTLALGEKPAYMNVGIIRSSMLSIVQGLKQIGRGLALKGGDQRQVGGEFLFEPEDVRSPIGTPGSETAVVGLDAQAAAPTTTTTTGHGAENSSAMATHGSEDSAGPYEEKRVTWCHRMRSTRDHAEIPELMEILGLDGQGKPIDNKKRWTKALESRKGTGLSLAPQMKAAQQNGNVLAAKDGAGSSNNEEEEQGKETMSPVTAA
jgi:hypothetical protein